MNIARISAKMTDSICSSNTHSDSKPECNPYQHEAQVPSHIPMRHGNEANTYLICNFKNYG